MEPIVIIGTVLNDGSILTRAIFRDETVWNNRRYLTREELVYHITKSYYGVLPFKFVWAGERTAA